MNISDEKYERLMLLIFFETLTMITTVLFYEKVFNMNMIQLFIFIEAIAFLQLPFISFIQNDFLAARPTLAKQIAKWIIRLFIAAIVIGIFVITFIIDLKAGIVGTLLTAAFLFIQNWKKLEIYLRTKILSGIGVKK